MLNPRKNSFGNLFSTDNPSVLKNELGIKDTDKVLDAGCGGQPLPWAQVHIDNDLNYSNDRDGKPVPQQINIIQADICSLPFEDKSFEWALCIHVLEHVAAPEKACNELIRVAKRGFIETPCKGSELFAGYPSHRWLIYAASEKKLIFEQRAYIEHPLENFVMAQAQRNHVFRDLCLDTMRNLTCVQFVWEGGFEFEVKHVQGEAVFDYDNPDHAGRSHASYAINLLRHGAPAENTLFHADYAMRLKPDSKYVVHAASIVYTVLGRADKAGTLLKKLKDIWGGDGDIKKNVPLLSLGAPSDYKGLVYPGNESKPLFYDINLLNL